MKRFLILALVAVAGAANAQILNGGFETGDLSNWIVNGTNPSPVVTNVSPHTGSFAALLGTDTGGEPLGDGSMYQSFAVGGGGGTLSFWTKKFTTDSISFDWQDAYIQSNIGVTLATIFHDCATSDWTQWTVNMAPYAGQTVRLEFLVHQDGFGDDTSMRVDDVTFNAVPEPASMAALGLGAVALIRRRRKA